MSFQWTRTDATIGQGFLRIAREQIGKAISGAEDASESPERRIHEVRRRCKKLRALFRLARPDFSDYAAVNALVRDASRGLAAARDTRVTRTTLAELMQWAGTPIPANDEPPHATEADGELAALTEFAARMRELDQRTAAWRIDRIDLDTLATGLRQTYRLARRARRTAERHRTDEAFHEWRKYAKYHWNQLGLLESCAADIVPSAHKCTGDLAELLGQHHDLAVLSDQLLRTPDEFEAGLDIPFARDAANRRQTELEARIAALGQQAFAETPRALEARFSAYLEGWMAREAAE